jgi:hypothetical protein
MLHDLRSIHDGGSSDHNYTSVELLLQHLSGCELKVVPDTDTGNYHDDHNAVQLLMIDALSGIDSRLEVIQEENSVDAEHLLDDSSGCDACVCEQKFNDRPAISRLEVIQEESSVDANFSVSEDEDQLCLPCGDFHGCDCRGSSKFKNRNPYEIETAFLEESSNGPDLPTVGVT